MAAVVVIEILGMVLEPKIHESVEDGLWEPRLVVGWGPQRPGPFRASRSLNGRKVYDVTYTIYSNLNRQTLAGEAGKGISVFGDSFIFGEGLEDHQTLPQQLANLQQRRSPIYNLGFSAYNPAHALARLQSGIVDRILSNTRVIVKFVAPWHAERTTCKAKYKDAPHYIIWKGELLYAGTCQPRPSRLYYLAMYRTFIRPRLTVVPDTDIETLVRVTQEVIRVAKGKYEVPIVIYYLRDPNYLRSTNWTDDQIMAEFGRAGAKVLDYTLEDSPAYEITGDGHPTALANSIRAERLERFLQREFPDQMTP